MRRCQYCKPDNEEVTQASCNVHQTSGVFCRSDDSSERTEPYYTFYFLVMSPDTHPCRQREVLADFCTSLPLYGLTPCSGGQTQN